MDANDNIWRIARVPTMRQRSLGRLWTLDLGLVLIVKEPARFTREASARGFQRSQAKSPSRAPKMRLGFYHLALARPAEAAFERRRVLPALRAGLPF